MKLADGRRWLPPGGPLSGAASEVAQAGVFAAFPIARIQFRPDWTWDARRRECWGSVTTACSS
jgi:hypothetical protein